MSCGDVYFCPYINGYCYYNGFCPMRNTPPVVNNSIGFNDTQIQELIEANKTLVKTVRELNKTLNEKNPISMTGEV